MLNIDHSIVSRFYAILHFRFMRRRDSNETINL